MRWASGLIFTWSARKANCGLALAFEAPGWNGAGDGERAGNAERVARATEPRESTKINLHLDDETKSIFSDAG